LFVVGVSARASWGLGAASRPAGGAGAAPTSSPASDAARIVLPDGVKRLAVARLQCRVDGNMGLSELAGRLLCEKLTDANAVPQRLEVIDLSKSHVPQAEPNDTAKYAAAVLDAAKRAGAQAVLCGTVSAEVKDEKAVKQVFDAVTQKMKTVPHTNRTCRVALSLTVLDVQTGRTLWVRTASKEFDSSKGTGGLGNALGFGPVEPPPLDQTLRTILEMCAEDVAAAFPLPAGPPPATAPAASATGADRKFSIRVLNATGEKQLAQVVQNERVVAQAEVPPDGGKVTLVVRQAPGEKKEYTLKAGRLSRTFTLDENSPNPMSLIITPDGK
jgi:hypothetical protein